MGERISKIQVCLRLTALIANICVLPVLAVMFVKMTLVKNSVAAPGSEISEYDPGFLGIKKLFFWRHGIPMAITFVSFLIVAIIIIVEQIKTKKSYNAIANNEYTPKIVEEDGAEQDEKEETDE